MNKQRLELVGRVVATPEVQTSKAKKKYSRVRIAANWKSKSAKGKEQEEVTFYEVLLFDKKAEKSENLDKGMLIRTLGDLEIKPFLTKKGEAKVDLTLIAREFQVFDSEVFK